MLGVRFFLLIMLINISLFGDKLIIDKESSFNDLLPYSSIYIDKSKKLSLVDVKKRDLEFVKNEKRLLGYGYNPDFNVWIRFTVKNNSNEILEKVLEYDNPLTTDIDFYDDFSDVKKEEGLFHISSERKTINPIFKFTLLPQETRTFYIKVSSHITTLIIKLNLWSSEEFFKKEINHQFVMALFFGAMFVLAIYNLFIYFFTKDISYLYYVLYMFGIIAHHLVYVGVSSIYILTQEWAIYLIEYAAFLVAFPAIALAMFTKTFIQTEQYPRLDKLLQFFIVFLLISSIVFVSTDEFNRYRNLFPFLLLLLLVYITIYASIKKNRQAYFILFGWFVFITAGMVMYISSVGIFNLYLAFPYYVETTLIIEAIVFSIALAFRIRQLQKERNDANKRLLQQQQNETRRLEVKVDEKTKDLKAALGEKDVLLKEINHRVKNNMQTIVSLLRLQGDEIDDNRLQDIFLTVQNRISAMSHLHELLYKQDNISHINTYEYFDALICELEKSYEKEAEIRCSIEADLKMEEAIYCGLILNELLTNSLKYAFKDEEGLIEIMLKKDKNLYIFNIKDNGRGYDSSEPKNSLGLVLVNTLVLEQLGGIIETDSKDGVKVEMRWESNG